MKAVILAVLAGLCWATGELCTKLVLDSKEVGPITAVTVRCVVAMPIMLLVYMIAVPMMKSEPTEWMKAPPGVLWKLVLGSGVVAGALALVFFYSGLKAGEISVVKPIAFTVAPAAAVLLGWWILGEKPSAQKLAGVACVLIGVVLIATAKKQVVVEDAAKIGDAQGNTDRLQ